MWKMADNIFQCVMLQCKESNSSSEQIGGKGGRQSVFLKLHSLSNPSKRCAYIYWMFHKLYLKNNNNLYRFIMKLRQKGLFNNIEEYCRNSRKDYSSTIFCFQGLQYIRDAIQTYFLFLLLPLFFKHTMHILWSLQKVNLYMPPFLTMLD